MTRMLRFVLVAAFAIGLLPLAVASAQDPVTIRITNWADITHFSPDCRNFVPLILNEKNN